MNRFPSLVVSAKTTFHCLVGCSIGEIAGLAIGVTLALGAVWTVTLAVILAYISGFTLAAATVMRSLGFSLTAALRAIWVGETISIAVMEIAMNTADYAAGGLDAPSVLSAPFWIGLAAALPAGFIAAWPVNHWLIGRELKACH